MDTNRSKELRKHHVFIQKTLLVCILIFVLLIITKIVLVINAGGHPSHLSHLSGDKNTTVAHYTKSVDEIQKQIENAAPAQASVIEEEALLLARLVYAEAGICSDDCQIAVASVVLNRIESGHFPDTIYDVIYQPGQYETTWNGAIEQEPSEDAIRNAYYVYKNGSQIPCTVLYQSNFLQGELWAEIDGEYFCYE